MIERVLVAAVLSISAAAAMTAPAAAATAKAIVSIHGCYTNDAQSESIPAGTKLVIQTGWLTKTQSQQSVFRNALRMHVTVNNVALTNLASHWAAPFYSSSYKAWDTLWNYPLSVVGAGQQKAVVMSLTLTRTITDGFTTYPKGTTNYDCVITGT
jgi:hypothetical protein